MPTQNPKHPKPKPQNSPLGLMWSGHAGPRLSTMHPTTWIAWSRVKWVPSYARASLKSARASEEAGFWVGLNLHALTRSSGRSGGWLNRENPRPIESKKASRLHTRMRDQDQVESAEPNLPSPKSHGRVAHVRRGWAEDPIYRAPTETAIFGVQFLGRILGPKVRHPQHMFQSRI